MKFQKISALLVCCLFMQSVSASSKKYEKDATSPSSSYGDFASLAEDHDARKKNEGQGGASSQKFDDSQRFVSMMGSEDEFSTYYEFLSGLFSRPVVDQEKSDQAKRALVNSFYGNSQANSCHSLESSAEKSKSLFMYMSSQDGVMVNGLQCKQPKAVKSQEKYFPTDFADSLHPFQDKEN